MDGLKDKWTNIRVALATENSGEDGKGGDGDEGGWVEFLFIVLIL